MIFCNHVKSSWMLECFLDSIFDSLHSCKWYNMKSYQHDSLWCQYSSSDLCTWHVALSSFGSLWPRSADIRSLGRAGNKITLPATGIHFKHAQISHLPRNRLQTSQGCRSIDYLSPHATLLWIWSSVVAKKIQSSMTWNFMKLASPKVSCCVSTTI